MPLPEKGVENRRSDAMADILKNREGEIDRELKEGGTAEGIAVLARDVPEGDPLRPESIPVEDWAAMSDESKNQAIAEAKRDANEAAAETPEAKEAREKAEKDEKTEKEEVERKVEPKKVTIKVDGQEMEVDEERVREAGIRALQKETAADKRLEEATRARDEAERLRKTAEAAAAQPTGKQKTEQELLVEKDALRGIVKAIQYGGEEEAAAALQEYGQKMAQLGQANALTTAELNNMLDLREAQKYVRTEYADVMGDSNLKQLFVFKVNEKIAAGDARPYQDLCKDVGDELRKWKGAPPAAEPTLKKDEGGSRATVHQRKTSTVQVTSAAARQPAPTQQKASTPTDTVQKMRADRDRQAGRSA